MSGGVSNPQRLLVDDEGVAQGLVSEMDFVGAGVTAVVTGNKATVTISGGAGSTVTEVELNVLTITRTASFTVVDGTVSPTSKITMVQSGAAATSRQSDENEMDPILVSCAPGTGSFVAFVNGLTGPIFGKYKFNYSVG